MKLQLRTLSSLLVLIALAILSACGDSSSSSDTEKTITGKALKPDGTVFEAGSTVTAVDQNGNTARATVDANGNFSVALTSVASSGKKAQGTNATGVIQISNGAIKVNGVVPADGDKANVNAITAAAAALLLSNINVDALISNAVAALEAGGKTVNVTALAGLAAVTKESLKSTATQVVDALFGVDGDGNSTIDAEKFLSGDFNNNDKATVLLKAAATTTGDLIAAGANAASSVSSVPLLNNAAFFQAIGNELSDVDGKANDFINDMIKSGAVKDALKGIVDSLQEYITAVVSGETPVFEVVVPTSAETPTPVTIAVSRSGSSISYNVSGAKDGDKNTAAITVHDGGNVKAIVTATLTYNGTGISPSLTIATVVTGNVQVTINNVSSVVTDNAINLNAALDAARSALVSQGQPDLASKVPTTTAGLTLHLSGTAVTRGGKSIQTVISNNGVTVNSVTGVSLQ